MKYNLKKNSIKSDELTDDRGQKSLIYNQWHGEFINLLESGDLYAIQIFINKNKMISGFQYFLMSMLSYVQSVYGAELYKNILNIVKDNIQVLREKINEQNY